MHISVDGGALCTKSRFGTTIFSQNLLKAISLYDTENTYFVYTFCKTKDIPETGNMKQQVLLPNRGWMKLRVSAQEFVHPKDIFLAVNQSIPLFTQSRIITFSHGLSFLKFPYLYGNEVTRLTNQLDAYLKRSDVIVVSSSRIKEELVTYNKKAEKRTKVIPFGIPFDMQEYKTQKRENVILFVGNNQPIKNVHVLVQIAQELDIPLILVGPFSQYKSEDIQVYETISRKNLKDLYQKAAVYVSVSHYESFNLPVVEAISQKCPVYALRNSVIPELKRYVHSFKSVEQLKIALKQQNTMKLKIDYESFTKEFSWEEYVRKLILLYNTL